MNRDLHKKSLTPGQVTFKFRGQTQYHVVDMGAGSFHSFAILAHKKNRTDTKVRTQWCGLESVAESS